MTRFYFLFYFVSILCSVQGDDCIYDGETTGEVHESAPSGTMVLNVTFINGTTELSIELMEYFELNETNLVIKPNVTVTRDDGINLIISGTVTCNLTVENVSITIIRNNLSPPMMNGDFQVSVYEILKLNESVMSINATDPDVCDVTFSISDQNPAGYFGFLAPNSGEVVTIKSLQLNSEHRETFHIFTITATSIGTDNLGNPLTQSSDAVVTVTILVDNPPQFLPCDSALEECGSMVYFTSVKIGSLQLSELKPQLIEAEDIDTEINATISYSFLKGNPDDYEDYFTINDTTGEVSIIKPVLVPGLYSITVEAYEETGKSNFATLSVECIDTVPVDQFSDSLAIGFISAFSVVTVLLIIVCIMYFCKFLRNDSNKESHGLEMGKNYETAIPRVSTADTQQPHQYVHNMQQHNDYRHGHTNRTLSDLSHAVQMDEGEYVMPNAEDHDDQIYQNT